MNATEYAKRELNKYLRLMTNCDGGIAVEAGDDTDLFREEFIIDVKEGKGVIRANRPRALLIGVYDFLRRCGCRFLRPGKAGEYVPKRKIEEINVSASVRPANRHRGITIEGAVSLENVLEIIEWAPKAGFNTYFIQFMNSFEFFDRWYSHKGNDLLAAEPFSQDKSRACVKEIVKAIKMRDMIYHAVGHGWTAACMGLECNGWSIEKDSLDENSRSMLAEVNGKRGFFGGIPLNTQLCYSSPAVRSKLVDKVVEYAENHSEADVIHFWLADGFNNVCECEECAKKSFSDWYVMILNEIDRRFTEKNIPAKICFLVYFDLYWAPQTERIENEDRFIMMFAPIFRTYTSSYNRSEKTSELNYVRNKIEYPHTVGTYIKFLEDWKKIFHGDSFDFDYHLMWDINRDFGGESLSEVLFDDIRSLHGMGLNGFVSCQVQRAFYPSGLAFYVMGRALLDGETDFVTLRREYYDAAFGKNAKYARKFYGMLEEYLPFDYFEGGTLNPECGDLLPKFVKAKELLTELLTEPVPEAEDAVRGESMGILRFAAGNVLRFLNVMILKLCGADKEKIAEADKERKEFFNSHEMRFQPYADGFYINLIIDGLIASQQTGIYA